MFIGKNDRGFVVVFDYQFPHELQFCIQMVEGLRDTAETDEARQQFAEAVDALKEHLKPRTLQ